MKIKTLALTALAASMTFAACDNEDNGGSQPQDLMPKSVTITLPNIQKSTRATGDAMPGGSQVELTNFKVFFVNSANEAVTVPQFNNEDQKVFFSSEDDDWGTATGNKLTYHFLPATTAKVVVVGNIGDETYDNVKTKVCDVQNDADGAHPSYPLYGESGLTKGAAADDEGHNNVYTATVTLEPRVSRFEIYGFEYTGTKYTSVELDKIALNHYYTKYNFVTKAPQEEGECFEDLTPTNAWDWIAGRTAPWADALTLTLNAGEKKFVDGTTIDDPAEDGEEPRASSPTVWPTLPTPRTTPSCCWPLSARRTGPRHRFTCAASSPDLRPEHSHRARSTGYSIRSRMQTSTSPSAAWS